MGMSMDQLTSILSRVLFAGAFLLLAIAFLERIVVAYGYTILRGSVTGGRLLEISATIVVFLIALLLRQIRDELKTRGS
jgi:hypothetical protein